MASGKSLQIEVVSHEARLWHGAALAVQIPSVDGSLGILPGRQPLLAQLGEQRLAPGKNAKAAVDTGNLDGERSAVPQARLVRDDLDLQGLARCHQASLASS